jgi:hypothetical protein
MSAECAGCGYDNDRPGEMCSACEASRCPGCGELTFSDDRDCRRCNEARAERLEAKYAGNEDAPFPWGES